MEKSFFYESKKAYDSSNLAYEFTVNVEFTARHEDEADIDSISVYLKGTDIEVKFESLPKADQMAIEDEAYQIAQDNAYEAYYDRLQATAEAQVDLMGER